MTQCVACCLREVGADGAGPQSEGHVSTRWDPHYRVYDANGLNTIADRPVYEVDAVNGWAIRYTTWPPALITCPSCGAHEVVEAQIERGIYRIELVVRR